MRSARIVVGAGPAGLAAAWHLTVVNGAGGVVRVDERERLAAHMPGRPLPEYAAALLPSRFDIAAGGGSPGTRRHGTDRP